MKKVFLSMALLICGLVLMGAGCSWFGKSTTPTASPTQTQTTVMPGSDRDEHGCIPSAGYTWCEAKKECLRVWEEECK